MAGRDVTHRRQILGGGLPAGAAGSGAVAVAHMRATAEAYGVICGSGGAAVAHCAACYVAVGLLLAGLVVLARPAFDAMAAAPARHRGAPKR